MATAAMSIKRRPSALAALILLSCVLVLAILVSTSVGAVHVSLAEVLRTLLHPKEATESGVIVFSLRLPRVLAAALAGAGLAATGVLFQGLFRNPLADPFVLGASGGAALGGAMAVFLFPTVSFFGVGASALLAFAGALLTMVVVWTLAGSRSRSTIENMLLAGFAVGTMLNAGTSAFELRQEATNPGARILASWLYGQIGIPPWIQLAVAMTLMVAGIAVAMPLARSLNTLALGEEYAAQLGVKVGRVRAEVLIIGSLLTALAVSLGGLIGFVGLLVPHFLRIVLGPDHFRLLPVAAVGGAAFLVIADTVARTLIAPTELPVGILTAFIGGPAFLYLLNRRKGAA
ncbi:MAG TPA: iron ABC transporter permease [Terriglobales bacterium]|nr:iron ABC transporter permease [Terriglobales bacterium]